jgi:putative intracellular protease/amidase
MKEARVGLAVCIANTGYEDLEVRKVYRVLADAKAAVVGCLRVIDESGEDYLYPADRFMVLELSGTGRKCLLAALEADAA